MARPLGEISQALLDAAKDGPATAAQLAARAKVGRAVAGYTCSHLIAAGHLVIAERLAPAGGRGRPPQLLSLPEGPAGVDLAAVMGRWFA